MVDKLTIVAHDKFQEIVDAANSPDSIIRKENIITIDAEEMVREAERVYETMVDTFTDHIIEIPRIMILQQAEVKSGFHDFELDTGNLNYQPVSEEILVRKLREQENGIDIVIGKGRIVVDTPESIHHYTETIIPTSAIPGKVFSGFRKTWHPLNKFDSKTEKDFAIILEQDREVVKWLRPAPSQFWIYWKHNSRRYHPDFVAETGDTIYLIETKKETDIETSDVQEKTQAALLYCRNATAFTTENSGKPWKYILIPHNAVMVNMSFDTLARRFEVRNG